MCFQLVWLVYMQWQRSCKSCLFSFLQKLSLGHKLRWNLSFFNNLLEYAYGLDIFILWSCSCEVILEKGNHFLSKTSTIGLELQVATLLLPSVKLFAIFFWWSIHWVSSTNIWIRTIKHKLIFWTLFAKYKVIAIWLLK